VTLARHSTSGIVRALISVTDAERALRCYRDVLGLPTEPRGPGIVALALPDGAEVLLHQRPATPSLVGIAVTFGVDDVDVVTAAATAAGCAVLHPPTDEP
jgi:predicted enzyme related to lactoylglutathione lyase